MGTVSVLGTITIAIANTVTIISFLQSTTIMPIIVLPSDHYYHYLPSPSLSRSPSLPLSPLLLPTPSHPHGRFHPRLHPHPHPQSFVEVPRYSFYALSQFSVCPYWLRWLRYSLFTVLYPLGISSELLCIWTAFPYLKQTNLWSLSMPNSLNLPFSYYWCVAAISLLYIPGAPFLYNHMIRQRNKSLKPSPKLHEKAA